MMKGECKQGFKNEQLVASFSKNISFQLHKERCVGKKKGWSGLVVLIAICWVITGCQQSSASSGTVEQKLVIEKYIADNQYGHAVKMKDQNQVQKVQQWLKDVSWREEKAEMIRKPNYILHFEPVETKKDIKVQ